MAPALVVVAGATATGKTELAIRLAEAYIADGRAAAIISADSRQVYRGLDIGTAKATAADRARAPHHGLDLVEPDQAFSLADFATHARAVLDDLSRRDGAIAILAGGTGLYLRAVATGLDTDSLPSDPAVRARVEAELETDGLDALVARLRTLAPNAATRVDLRNPRRVVYAEGEDERTLRAVQTVLDEGLAEPILIGRRAVIAERARAMGLRMDLEESVRILDPAEDTEVFAPLTTLYQNKVGRRGIPPDSAARRVAFGPSGDESPAQHHAFGLAFVLADHRDVAAAGHVEARGEAPPRMGEAEFPFHLVPFRYDISLAHCGRGYDSRSAGNVTDRKNVGSTSALYLSFRSVNDTTGGFG